MGADEGRLPKLICAWGPPTAKTGDPVQLVGHSEVSRRRLEKTKAETPFTMIATCAADVPLLKAIAPPQFLPARFFADLADAHPSRLLTRYSKLRHKYQLATEQYGCQSAANSSICLGCGSSSNP